MCLSTGIRGRLVTGGLLANCLLAATTTASPLSVVGNSQAVTEPCSAIQNFDYLWSALDENYGIFSVKGVNWTAIRAVYRPRAQAATSCAAFFDVLAEMLGTLNDYHIFLFDGARVAKSGAVDEADTATFELALVRRHYALELETDSASKISFGWLPDSLGYIHLGAFEDPEVAEPVITRALTLLDHARGLIVDVRNNGGGSDATVKLFADRFADRKRLFMITRIRNGGSHDDFEPPRYWNIEPQGAHWYHGQVMLLTNRHSTSAAEDLALALRTLPTVTQIGETTSGVFSDIYTDTLPNGWQFAIPYARFTDHAGKSWEGIGITPNLRTRNDPLEVRAGRDRTLELARDLLTAGARRMGDDAFSSSSGTTSIPDLLLAAARSRSSDSLAHAFQRGRQSRDITPGTEAEYLDAARSIWREGKQLSAIEVARYGMKVVARPWRSHALVGDYLVSMKKVAEARQEYQLALALNAGRNASQRRWKERIQRKLDETGTN
jgi:carboxyl-terminal processing protease